MSYKPKCSLPYYTIGEEICNALSHGIAAMVSVAGILALISRAGGRTLETVAVTIYGLSMLLAFSMSTLYHAFTNPKIKKVLRVLDHTSVYLLIAGTYTPFTLITLRGPIGWWIFGIVWATSIFGIILKLINLDKYKKLSMACCISAGWCIIVAIVPICQSLPLNGLMLLFLGGILYTAGLYFYGKKQIRYMHTTWHFFVLAGAAAHYFSILFYVL